MATGQNWSPGGENGSAGNINGINGIRPINQGSIGHFVGYSTFSTADPDIYSKAPGDFEFNEMKENALEMWVEIAQMEPNNPSHLGYANDKMSHIRAMSNKGLNFMEIFNMFDPSNSQKLIQVLSKRTRLALKERLESVNDGRSTYIVIDTVPKDLDIDDDDPMVLKAKAMIQAMKNNKAGPSSISSSSIGTTSNTTNNSHGMISGAPTQIWYDSGGSSHGNFKDSSGNPP